MEQRLIDLETRQAFQEDTLEQLNEVVIELRRQVDTLIQRLKVAEERLERLEPNIISSLEDDKPPHY